MEREPSAAMPLVSAVVSIHVWIYDVQLVAVNAGSTSVKSRSVVEMRTRSMLPTLDLYR